MERHKKFFASWHLRILWMRRGREHRRVPIAFVLVVLLSSCAVRSSQSSSPRSHRTAGDSSSGSSRSRPELLIGSRREFALHACVEFYPAGADRHRTIFIDPGHGGPDPGTAGAASDGTLLQEKRLTLTAALALSTLLRQDGYRVVLSRVQDGPVRRLLPGSLSKGLYTPEGVRRDLQARVDCANAAHAALLLSLHFDAFTDPTVGGVQTLYDPDRPFSGQSLRLGRLIQRDVAQAFAAHGWAVPDRGIVSDIESGTPALTAEGAHYGHLLELGPADSGWLNRPSRMPGALIEPLFLSDQAEADIAGSRAGQDVLVHALARAINAYFRP